MNKWVERSYSYLPVWAQNAAVTAFGVSYRTHRFGKDFDKYVTQFKGRDRWSIAQMTSYVQDELRHTLRHAFTHVPHYREVWTSSGITDRDLRCITLEDLEWLPVTSKNPLRADPKMFLAGDRRRRVKLYKNPSSGSTGTPITAIWSSDVRRKCMAAREARSFGWAGTSIRQSRAMIGGRPVVQDPYSQGPYYRYNLIERQVYFSAYHLSADRAARYLEGLNKYKPKVLVGYAHCYYFLARHMLEQGLKLEYRPDALVLGSEPVSQEMKTIMKQAFGARAYEEYGSVENCFLATECEAGRLHVSLDFGILEIVDEKGSPVEPGVPGRVLATGLLNDVQPLVRYEVGDVATWAHTRCECGRDQLPVLEAVEGRVEQTVVGPDGREMVRFHSLFLNLPRIIEGQVVQEALDRLRVKVVATDGFGPEEEKAIRQRVLQRLGRMEVHVERVPDIPRNRRGKFPAVVSLLSEADKRLARRLQ